MRLMLIIDDTVWEKYQAADAIDRAVFRQFMERRAKFSYKSYRHVLTEQGKEIPEWLDQPINYFVWHHDFGAIYHGDLKELGKSVPAITCYWIPEEAFQEWRQEQKEKGIDVGK